MVKGYIGKLLFVNLSTGSFTDIELEEQTCRDYLGGTGIGAKFLFSRQNAFADPLGPENILGFVTGIFTGTQALSGSRFSVVAKSPLTGTWGDSSSGGYFGPHLRFAGYDGVFFEGISPKPVFLFINNGKAELRDASKIWGKDTHDTEDMLVNELGSDVRVACIGPFGEKVSLISAILTDKGRAAGRSGMGAVMGSKRLKAIAVRGNAEIPVFDKVKVNELRKYYLGKLTGQIDDFRDYGTCKVVVPFGESGDSPVKNWSGICTVDFPGVRKIGDDSVIALQEKKYGCFRCPIACGGYMKAGTGQYKYSSGVHKPEYETLVMFGTNCLNDNLESIVKANDICNRYGIDTISAGSCISFAIDCYESGIITKKETGGIEMTWGNDQAIVAMLEIIAAKEGFGAILADGVKVAADKIGKGSDKMAIHIGGQELPGHDPKKEYGYASVYRMDATPGRHMRWHAALNPPGLPVPPYEETSWEGRGQAQRIGFLFNHVLEGLGSCVFVTGTFPDADVSVEFLNAITGWNWTLADLLKAGERIANIRQAFNIREGVNPLKFHIPGRVDGKPPFKSGPLTGKTIDRKKINREFLEAMGWNLRSGAPTERKLLELGMNDVAETLYGHRLH